MRYASVTSLVSVYLWLVKAVQHGELWTVYHFNGDLWQRFEPAMMEWHSSFHNVRPLQSLRLRVHIHRAKLVSVHCESAKDRESSQPHSQTGLCALWKCKRPREFTSTEPNWSLCTVKVQKTERVHNHIAKLVSVHCESAKTKTPLLGHLLKSVGTLSGAVWPCQS